MYALALILGMIQPLTTESPIRVLFGKSPALEVTVGKDAVARLKATKPTAKEWTAIFRVVVAGGTAAETVARPAVAGTCTAEGTAIRFEPHFPFSSDIGYRVWFDPAKLPGGDPKSGPVSLSFVVPKPPPGPPTTIAAVYPSANRLPENTLRLYIHFSGQMNRGNIYRHMKLIRDDGKEVPQPFLELDEELWSADGLRITVLFHPGRVKRELVPREEDGPILEEGRRYALVISREWKDAEGRPFPTEFKKTFLAGPPEEEPIDMGTWSLMSPRAGSDAPLILRLAKPLDRALLSSTFAIIDASGKRIEGETTVGGGERVVTFAPAKPWKKGEFKLVVDSRLEDACGNRVGEPFEVHTANPRTNGPVTLERRFVVR